jgi:hypothetical protein
MDQGTDPASEWAQELAERWMALVHEFSGGNPEIERAARSVFAEPPPVRQSTGIDQEMFAYIPKAAASNGQD